MDADFTARVFLWRIEASRTNVHGWTGCVEAGLCPAWTGQSPVPTQEESALAACGKNMQDLLQFIP
jgi:hypothetical protein